MKNTKRELMDVALFDYQYIQRHLTEMAAKGWRLVKIGSFGLWHYRRCEPARLRYEVTYAPSASAFNSRPTEAEEVLADLCADAGWVKVASMAQLHVYCNEDPNATPLETDELTRIRTLKKSMNRHFVPQYLLMAALFVVQLLMQLNTGRRWPVTSLSSPLYVGTVALMAFSVLMYLGMIAGYLHWVHKAEQAVLAGGEIPQSRFYRWFRFVIWFVILGYLAMLLMTSGFEIIGVTLGIATIAISVTGFTLNICKELNAPKWVNFLIPSLCCALALMLFMPLTFGMLDDVSMEKTEYPTDLPLMLTDLEEANPQSLETIAYEESASILLSRVRVWQECEDPDLSLHYTILDANAGFAWEMCLNYQEQQFIRSADILSYGNVLVNQGEVWGAEYARRAVSDGSDLWFICWENRIVSLRTNFVMTDEQIAAAAEILKP